MKDTLNRCGFTFLSVIKVHLPMINGKMTILE